MRIGSAPLFINRDPANRHRPDVNLRMLFLVFLVLGFATNGCGISIETELQVEQPPRKTLSVSDRNKSLSSKSVGEKKSVSDTTAEKSKQDERRKQTVQVAFYLLAGIILLGLAVIFGAIFWGGHVRRLMRGHRAKRTETDPLWYLRTGKKKTEKSGENFQDEELLKDDDEHKDHNS